MRRNRNGKRVASPAWAMSFLDLFTCALAGIFLLLTMTTKSPREILVEEPRGFFLIRARFAAEHPVADLVRGVDPDAGLDIRVSQAMGLLSIAGYVRDEATDEVVREIEFLAGPDRLEYQSETATESVTVTERPIRHDISGRGYRIRLRGGEAVTITEGEKTC